MSDKRKRSLAECKTLDEVCELGRDNFTAGDYWLISDSFSVTICAQKPGERATAKVTVPRRQFKKLIAAYLRPQTVRP